VGSPSEGLGRVLVSEASQGGQPLVVDSLLCTPDRPVIAQRPGELSSPYNEIRTIQMTLMRRAYPGRQVQSTNCPRGAKKEASSRSRNWHRESVALTSTLRATRNESGQGSCRDQRRDHIPPMAVASRKSADARTRHDAIGANRVYRFLTLLVSTIIKSANSFDHDHDVGQGLVPAFFRRAVNSETIGPSEVRLYWSMFPTRARPATSAALPFPAWRCAISFESIFGAVTTARGSCGISS